jgi:hypothetical protein
MNGSRDPIDGARSIRAQLVVWRAQGIGEKDQRQRLGPRSLAKIGSEVNGRGPAHVDESGRDFIARQRHARRFRVRGTDDAAAARRDAGFDRGVIGGAWGGDEYSDSVPGRRGWGHRKRGHGREGHGQGRA